MMWCKGRCFGNIFWFLKFKIIILYVVIYIYIRDDYLVKYFKVDGNKVRVLFGDDEENFDVYFCLQDYSFFVLQRIFIWIQNFKIY